MKKTIFSLFLLASAICAHATTYALFGTAPQGATDLSASVSASALGSAAFADGVFTGAGLPNRLCESNNYFQLIASSDVTMSLTDTMALHLQLKRVSGTGNVQVSLCNRGWNTSRASWQIDGSAITGEVTDIVLKFADRNTGNWNSYDEAKMQGTDVTFSREILRLCAAQGEQIEIAAIYVESTYQEQAGPENTEIPEQNAQRIYLKKGSAETPFGVAEIDYTAGSSLISEWWNCTPSEEFFGVTTNQPADGDWDNGWWFNFQLLNTTTVDLTPVYATWRMVVSVKNEVVEADTDRGLTVKVDGKELSFVTTIAEATSFVEHEMPFSTVLTGASHLKSFAPGLTIVDFSSSNDHSGNRNVEFDYIYFTNEDVTPTALEKAASERRAEKMLLNGRIVLLRDGRIYSVQGAELR